MTPEAFLDMLVGPAQECQRKTGIPASFTLAQAALESTWGRSELANRGRNLFGVKADASWHGAVVVINTGEHLNGKDVIVSAKWRCYATWQECIDDRAKFFQDNPRYADCFKETTGPGWCRAVAAAHYATDPAYAAKLIGIIAGRNLTRFDK